MAQSVTLWGASYSDVPAIDVPKTGGGTATFTDTTPTTASASDVLQGKYFFTANGVLTLGTNQGGGGTGGVTQDQDGYIVLDDQPGTSVTVEPLNVTQNGTYTAPTGKAYSPVSVNVSGGGGLEYETGTWTPSEDIARPTISFTNSHTERPIYVLMSDTSEALYDSSSYSMLEWAIINWYDAFGFGMRVGSSQINYARIQSIYKTSSFTTSAYNPTNLNGDSTTSDMGYFLTNTAFYPYTGSNTRYWTAGRTYKWIAVWAPTT